MADRYIIKDGEVVPCEDLMEWARWFGRADRTLARVEKNGVVVSTVFLGLDHSFGDGPPILWETMIFNGKHNGHQERSSTVKDAVLCQHNACVLAFNE